MSTPKDSPLLTPFGIRDLYGPLQPPGLVQISASQYEATLKEQPNASLKYLDDDDGELITVGSGFELRQRLEDPVSQSSSLVFTNPRNPLDGGLVHIFDIEQSNSSLTVWKDHHACSTNLRPKTVTSKLYPVLEDMEIKCETREEDLKTLSDEELALNKPVNAGDVITFDGCDGHISITELWEVFRNSDGVKSIHIDSNLERGSITYTSSSLANKAVKEFDGIQIKGRKPIRLTLGGHGITDSAQSGCGIIDKEDAPKEHQPAIISPVTADTIINGIEEHLSGLADVLQIAAITLSKAAKKTRETDTSVVEDVLKGVKGILTEVGSFGSEVFKAFEAEAKLAMLPPVNITEQDEPTSTVGGSSQTNSFAASVEDAPEEDNYENIDTSYYNPAKHGYSPIDTNASLPEQDTGDITFGRRNSYDQTVEELSVKKPFVLTKQSVNEANECSKRYSVSILDDEDSDADFTARYPPLMSVRRAQTVNDSSRRPRFQPYSRRGLAAETSKFSDALPLVNSKDNQMRKHTAEKQEPIDGRKPLPGAWPESNPEQAGSNLAPSGESSGEFFNRMVNRDRPLFSGFPFQNNPIRRYNTTASANPASRLTGPFDPGFPFTSKQAPEKSGNRERLTTYGPHPFGFRPAGVKNRYDRPAWAHAPTHPGSETLKQPTGPKPFHFQRPVYPPPPFPNMMPMPPPPGMAHMPPPPPPPPCMSHMPPPPPPPPQHPSLRHFQSVPVLRMNPPSVPSVPSVPSSPSIPAPSSIFSASQSNLANNSTQSLQDEKLELCVKQLKTFGYGCGDRNMADRLYVYAVAADGDVTEAIEMIEEDRKAIHSLDC